MKISPHQSPEIRSEREHFRLFVALEAPKDVKDRMASAQDELRRAAGDARVRWTTREQFHLTLRFLGNVEDQQLEPLTTALQSACREFGALHLRAEEIGFFPNARLPQVVWAGVGDAQQRLPRLHEVIENAVRNFTAEPAEDRFTGHITLGRFKEIRRPDAAALARAAEQLAGQTFGAWTAPRIELVRSQLSPKGATYTCLAEIPL